MKRHGISETGWWIAGILEKHYYSDRPPYWNNYRLIKADDWRTAYSKAVKMGQDSVRVGNEALAHRQEFIGITDLLPIYDDFKDGAEMLWQELWPDNDQPDGAPLRVYSVEEMELEYGEAAEQVSGGNSDQCS